jgi:dCMP deaminase
MDKDIKWINFCIAGAKIFSTCGKSQFMCIIVDRHSRVAGLGYNGVPSGMLHCIDGGCPRFLNNVPAGVPYDHGDGLCFSGHAEQNALANADASRYEGSTLYINGFPCLTCAKMIACSGIRRIVCVGDDRVDSSVMLKLLSDARIEIVNLQSEQLRL